MSCLNLTCGSWNIIIHAHRHTNLSTTAMCSEIRQRESLSHARAFASAAPGSVPLVVMGTSIEEESQPFSPHFLFFLFFLLLLQIPPPSFFQVNGWVLLVVAVVFDWYKSVIYFCVGSLVNLNFRSTRFPRKRCGTRFWRNTGSTKNSNRLSNTRPSPSPGTGFKGTWVLIFRSSGREPLGACVCDCVSVTHFILLSYSMCISIDKNQ